MEKEDRELIKLLNDSKKGNKNSFEKFTRLVYQEVYNLVAFVYITKESREKLTKHVLVRMFKNASEFDNEELDIHLWIARFTTVEVYNVCKKQNGELFDTQISAEEYNYDSISEDSEFAKCAADYNQAFLDIDQLNEIMTDFEDFSKGQRLLYLMFAYESYTIDEIEDLLEIDSTFIGTQIMQIRGMLGLDMVSLDGDGSQVHVADEDSSEDETDDEDSSDDSVPEIDFDDNDNYSDRYDAKSANHGIKADARMRGIIAICAALVVVLAVVTVAIAGRIKKNKSKSTFNPTPVTTAAEEATTKKSSKNNNATTKAAETTTTKAAETDEQTEAATTRRTQTQTNDTEAAGDTEDGGNAGGSGSGDSGSTDGSGSGDSGDTGGSGSGDSGSTGGSGSGDSGDTDGSGSGDSGDTAEAVQATAEAQAEAVQATAEAQVEAVRVTAEAQVEAVRVTAEAQVEAVQVTAEAQAEAVQAIVEAQAEAVQVTAEAQMEAVQAIVETQVEAKVVVKPEVQKPQVINYCF